jgi:redox-sensitive bicupin YhaK (pirin superfamily)
VLLASCAVDKTAFLSSLLFGVAARSDAASTGCTMKAIKQILPAPTKHWVGNGFHVAPVFHSKAFTAELSPWLMFDYAEPKAFGPTRTRRGVGRHPHRGFETVTIAFQGEVEHGDSVGNRGVIGPGDVQWMTAGRGIVHEEYHSGEFSAKGGAFEMAQLWVNLPRKSKMAPPSYQPILDRDIPVAPLRAAADFASDGDEAQTCELDQARVRVIAGALNGVTGPAHVHTPIELWDVHLDAVGKPFELDIPEGHNAIIFARAGTASVGAPGDEREIVPQGVAILRREGTTVRLVAREPGTKLLVLGGEPIDEPIAARGPFVMNTEAELRTANEDYRAGRLGQ